MLRNSALNLLRGSSSRILYPPLFGTHLPAAAAVACSNVQSLHHLVAGTEAKSVPKILDSFLPLSWTRHRSVSVSNRQRPYV
jgi:hypothetical protein